MEPRSYFIRVFFGLYRREKQLHKPTLLRIWYEYGTNEVEI